jgi:hypothetical protein
MKIKLINISKNLIILLISIILSIYIIEIAYSFYKVSGFKAKKLSNEVKNKFDEFVKLKENNKNLTVVTPPVFLLSQKKSITKEIFPLSGISNILTINCNENGYFSRYHSDRYGFNNKDELWNKEIDLITIGDSFTHGACVNYPHTFAGNFNLKFNTLNLGYGGNGPLMELGTIKEYIDIINPKKVIWIFSDVNDLKDIQKEFKHQILKRYVTEKSFLQNLKEKQNIINNLQSNVVNKEFNKHLNKKRRILNYEDLKFKNILYLSNLKNLIRYQFKIDIAKDEIFEEGVFELFDKVIFEANRVVKKNGAELYFVFLPRFPGKIKKSSFRFQTYQKILSITKKHGIKVIDLHNLLFNKLKDPKSFFPGRVAAHYTEYGYRVASEVILENIYK